MFLGSGDVKKKLLWYSRCTECCKLWFRTTLHCVESDHLMRGEAFKFGYGFKQNNLPSIALLSLKYQQNYFCCLGGGGLWAVMNVRGGRGTLWGFWKILRTWWIALACTVWNNRNVLIVWCTLKSQRHTFFYRLYYLFFTKWKVQILQVIYREF